MNRLVVIIGGGVAGLSAANQLADLGIPAMVIEAGDYPAHKVCGEFLAPDCLKQLKAWGIEYVPIQQARLHTQNDYYIFSFPQSAGSLSHWQLDPLLAERARKKGVEVKTGTQVKRWSYDNLEKVYHIELNSGLVLKATEIIMATGRIPGFSQNPPTMLYMGIKAHFEGIPVKDRLEMFSFPDAYVGIAPIEDQKCNVACLARLESVEKAGSPMAFMEQLRQQNHLFYEYFSSGRNLFDHWMTTSIPTFGIKNNPDWPQVYLIGDAAATIPPACGAGLALALAGGCLAANYVAKKDSHGFNRVWLQRCRKPIRWGQLLHQAMMRPLLGSRLIKVIHYMPFIARTAYQLTRLP